MSDKPVLRTPAELLSPYRDLAKYLVLAKASPNKGVVRNAREAAKLLKQLEAALDGIYAETRDAEESGGTGKLYDEEITPGSPQRGK